MLERIGEFLRLGLVPNTKLYLTGVPLLLLASVSSYVSPGELTLSLWYLLANLIALVGVLVVFLVGQRLLSRIKEHQLVLREGRPQLALAALIAFGFLLGLSKQLGTATALVLLGLEDDFGAEVLSRSLTPLLGVWYVVALGSFQSAQVRFSKIREELIAERVRRLSVSESDTGELREFANQAQELLKQGVGQESSAVAALIRSIVTEQLRPLSHRLWEREQQRTPGFGGRELAMRALGHRPYRTLPILVLFSIASIPPMVSLAGSQWWLPFLVLTGSTTLVLQAANFIRRRSELAKRQFVLSLVATAGFATSISFGYLFLLGYLTSPILWISSAWWLGTLMVVIGVLVVGQQDHEQQRQLLAQLSAAELDSAATDSVRAIRNRELANLLHSRTQNRMLAQAMRIESGADLKTELAELKQLLESLPNESTEVLDLAQLRQRWRGVLDVDYEFDSEPSQLVLRVCEEAISNALRHGMATRVEIALDGERLTVSDNGLGPVQGSAGLGSKLFDSAGMWQLVARDEGGAKLEIQLGPN